MTSTVLEETPVSSNSDDNNLEHYYCECDDTIAICGDDITDAPDNTDVDTPLEDDCVVCLDLIDSICPRCGCS